MIFTLANLPSRVAIAILDPRSRMLDERKTVTEFQMLNQVKEYKTILRIGIHQDTEPGMSIIAIADRRTIETQLLLDMSNSKTNARRWIKQ